MDATPYPLVRLLAAPSTDARVLYDFNAEGRRVQHDGFSLGAPRYLGDPGSISPELGPRTIAFTHQIKDTEAAAGNALVEMNRALLAGRGYLMIVRSPSHAPAFARTYASAPDELNWELARNAAAGTTRDIWQVGVRIDADAAFLGEQISWDPFTITNNPATGGCFQVLPDVKGDLPAPLRVRIEAEPDTIAQFLLTVTGMDDPGYDAPYITGQFTTGTTLSTAVADAASFTGQRRNIPIPDSSGIAIANVTLPAQTGQGRYRVMARVVGPPPGVDAPLDDPFYLIYSFGYMQGVQAGFSGARTIKITKYTGRFWLDFGVIDIPSGIPLDLLTGQLQVGIGFSQVAGETMQLAFDDALVLVPINSATCQTVTTIGGGESTLVGSSMLAYDIVPSESGDTDLFVTSLASGTWGPVPRLPLKGGGPVVFPGSNVLHFFSVIDDSTVDAATIAAETEITVSYQPRYLSLPGN